MKQIIDAIEDLKEKYLNINDERVSRDYKIVKAQIESLPTLLA